MREDQRQRLREALARRPRDPELHCTIWRRLLDQARELEAPLVYGRLRKEGGGQHLQLLALEAGPNLEPLATLRQPEANAPDPELARIDLGARQVAWRGQSAPLEILDETEYAARNQGLLLCRELNQRTAVLVGMGSVGSRIAAELTRLGIRLELVDPDRVSVANPIRWGLTPEFTAAVGRAKTIVAEELLTAAYPVARVRGHVRDVVTDAGWFLGFLEDSRPDLVIVSTDTQDSRFLVNDLCVRLAIPALFVALADRAASVRIEYLGPDTGPGCHRCASLQEGELPLQQRRTRLAYAVDTAATSQAVPALSADISVATALATKLALLLLARADWRPYFRHGAQQGRVLFFSQEPDHWIFAEAFQKAVYQPDPRPDCPACAAVASTGA